MLFFIAGLPSRMNKRVLNCSRAWNGETISFEMFKSGFQPVCVLYQGNQSPFDGSSFQDKDATRVSLCVEAAAQMSEWLQKLDASFLKLCRNHSQKLFWKTGIPREWTEAKLHGNVYAKPKCSMRCLHNIYIYITQQHCSKWTTDIHNTLYTRYCIQGIVYNVLGMIYYM